MILEVIHDALGGALHVILHILAAVMPAFFFGGCGCCGLSCVCEAGGGDRPDLFLTVTNKSNCSCADNDSADEPSPWSCSAGQWDNDSGNFGDRFGCSDEFSESFCVQIVGKLCSVGKLIPPASPAGCLQCEEEGETYSCDTLEVPAFGFLLLRKANANCGGGTAATLEQSSVSLTSCSTNPDEFVFEAVYSSAGLNCGEGNDYTLVMTFTE